MIFFLSFRFVLVVVFLFVERLVDNVIIVFVWFILLFNIVFVILFFLISCNILGNVFILKIGNFLLCVLVVFNVFIVILLLFEIIILIWFVFGLVN